MVYIVTMESTNHLSNQNVLIACRALLDRYFRTYQNPALEKRAVKALRLLAAAEKRLAGKPEGWAAGVIYAVANSDRQACGVPGLLKSEFTEFFDVSMETVRKRSANVLTETAI